MANNTTEASFYIMCGTPANAASVVSWFDHQGPYPAELQKLMENESGPFSDGLPPYFIADATAEGDKVWVHISDGDVALTATILDYVVQTMPEAPSPQGFTWANYCSSPRVNEFDGGAVWCGRGQKWRWMNSTQWLERQA